MKQFADVIYVVKPLPVQNDATLEDISHAGLESDFGKVITTQVARTKRCFVYSIGLAPGISTGGSACQLD